jgi:hypothetical protein
LFAAALFLAAAFFVTYSEPDESDADIVGSGTEEDPWYCGPSDSDSVTATLTDDGVLTISGTGNMNDYSSYSSTPWYSVRMNITSIIIESGVTSIGDWAFFYCISLKTVTIPNGVTSIGEYAFCGCESLTSIDIPDSVIFIGDVAFADSGLTSFDIPSGMKTISNGVFSGSALLSIVIPDSVTYIESGAFYGCASLTSITIPDSVEFHGYESAGGEIFYGCTSLETVTVTGGLAGEEKTLLEDGVIDQFFKDGTDWKLPKMYSDPTPIKTLRLEGISSSDYDPNNEDGKGGIAGDGGRELYYSDLAFIWNEDTDEWDEVRYSVSGTISVTGGSVSAGNVTVSLISSSDPDTVYQGTVEENGDYTITGVPYGTTGNITVTLTGYHQTDTVSVTDLKSNETGKSIDLEINEYTVTLPAEGTEGISGFEYSINGSGTAVPYTEPFKVNHGDTLTVTALLSEGYASVSWSGYPESSVQNPGDDSLTVLSVPGNISLTVYASLIPVTPSPSDTYRVAFSSGSYYTVYAVDGSPISSSSISVTEGGSLTFGIQASEGYTAYPSVVSGSAKITAQADGRYMISDIRSDILVGITVNTVSGDGSGNGSSGSGTDIGSNGNSSGNSTGSSGSGNGSINSNSTDSENSISYWIPVLIIAVFLVCIGIAWIFLFFIKRRKDEEEDGN